MCEMSALDIARRLAELGQSEQACDAYTLYLRTCHQEDPDAELEAALYILQMGGNYKVSYEVLLSLHERGINREDCFAILTEAFYLPNEKELRNRYEKNCRLLSRYPYLFRKDFLSFDQLPIRFYPYDENSYVPYHVDTGCFGQRVNYQEEIIGRNFFHDLDKPVLATEVWSQHELEYLNDNVRKSEWVARENHIYLHYPDWAAFCAHLQHWEWKRLLKDEKFVFLIEEEIAHYPIDFKARFGLDYSRYPLKPISIREITRMIWHTQLSSHNGGDFFNEIFDAHPNLLFFTSIMHDEIVESIGQYRNLLKQVQSLNELQVVLNDWDNPGLVADLYTIKDPTDKDILVALYLSEKQYAAGRDPAARIVPAVFYQPHFENFWYNFKVYERDRTVLYSPESERIYQTQFFKQFKYIKTFTPLRRFTSSHTATMRFMDRQRIWDPESRGRAMPDLLPQRILNRSFMVERENRLFTDSVLVRFEDAKLNPKATFSALAAFVDVPYTESMGYCSFNGEQHEGRVGMSPEKAYSTYEEYSNHEEQYFLEYFLRDAYVYYGYDFHFYDGAPMTLERARELINGFTVLDGYIRSTWTEAYIFQSVKQGREEDEALKKEAGFLADLEVKRHDPTRIQLAEAMLNGLHFVDQKGRPLRMMPMLQPVPELLERPLYH